MHISGDQYSTWKYKYSLIHSFKDYSSCTINGWVILDSERSIKQHHSYVYSKHSCVYRTNPLCSSLIWRHVKQLAMSPHFYLYLFFLCFSLRTMHSTGLTHTSNRRSSSAKLHSQSMLQDIILHHLLFFKPLKKGQSTKRPLKNGSSWGTLLLLSNHEKVQRYPALYWFCRAL